MSRSTSVRYRLPRARLVVSGTLRRTYDQDLDANRNISTVPARLVSHAIELRHEAEAGDPRAVSVRGGWLFQYKCSFSFTEDLRLTKASSDTTGAGADLLSAGATVAGVALAAGVALGPKPDRFRKVFRNSHQAEANEYDTLITRRRDARQKVALLARDLVANSTEAGVLGPQIRQVRQLIGYYDERIAALDAVYAAWLATRQTTVEETFEIVAELADLKTTLAAANDSQNGYGSHNPAAAKSQAPTSLKDLWIQHGLTVLATWDRGHRDGQAPDAGPNHLVARLAEGITLSVVEHRARQPVVTSRTRALVADQHSEHVQYQLRRSLFGRRSLALTFSENGYLTGIAAEGSAALGETAKAIAAAPGQIAGAVDSVTKVQAGVASARRAGLDAELARVKAEVELRQQQALAAGLDLTSADAARLDRLTQLQSILDAQAKIKQAAPALAASLGLGTDQNLA